MSAPAQLQIDMLEKLPEREVKRLAELEMVIKQDLKAFLRVGAALAEISNAMLYRSEYHSFPEYLKSKWDVGESRGYQLIDAHIITEKLSTIVEEKQLPANEGQIRPLVKYKNDTEKLAQIWNAAVESAPEGKITARHVQQTLFNIDGKKTNDKTGKTRAAVNKDELLTKSFKMAFEAMLQEIELAKNSKYKNTSRQAILRHLDTLRETIANDGEALPDHTIKTKTDRVKLIEGGYRIIRANYDNLCIEEQTGAGFWEHLASCDDSEDLSREYTAMMRESIYLRG